METAQPFLDERQVFACQIIEPFDSVMLHLKGFAIFGFGPWVGVVRLNRLPMGHSIAVTCHHEIGQNERAILRERFMHCRKHSFTVFNRKHRLAHENCCMATRWLEIFPTKPVISPPDWRAVFYSG